MYEDKTVSTLHDELLKNVDSSYAKTVGYPMYDITRAFSIQEAKLYLALKLLVDKVDVDTLSGDDLTKYVKQRKGIIRKLATTALGVLTVTGNGTITQGDLFETAGGVQFKSLESKVISGSGTINIVAILPGSIGIVPANSITQMPVTINGIISVNNLQITEGGYDEESDTELRKRYYEALRKPPTSGNKYHYLAWAKEVTGVGDAKVYPLWKGDNTVKVVIIDSNKQPANDDLVLVVQNYIDPGITGKGEGEAPIGAYCTIQSVKSKEITIEVKVDKDTNFTDDEIKNNIGTNIKSYFQEIALSSENNYISYARVGNLIITASGVKDYSNLLINASTNNIPLSLIPDLTEIPVLKEVVLK